MRIQVKIREDVPETVVVVTFRERTAEIDTPFSRCGKAMNGTTDGKKNRLLIPAP